MRKEVNQLIEKLQRLPGWTVELRKGGHYIAKGPRPGLCIIAATPSDPRALRNIKATLRRLGAQL